MSEERYEKVKGKVLLCKLEQHPEIKRRFLECFDYDVFGDQLGLTPEIEENVKKIHENYGSERAAKEYLYNAKMGKLKGNWYEVLIETLKSESNGANSDLCKELELSAMDYENYKKKVINENKLDNNPVLSKVKQASIKKLKTFKNAFGESCDIFSKKSFEAVPRIKEDQNFQRANLETRRSQTNLNDENNFETLEHLITFEGSSSHPYISISGEAGSGKTFLTNIISRKFYEKDFLCFNMNLNQVSQNKKINLGQFLTKYCCVDLMLDNKEFKFFVNWLVENQSRFVLILDGLDQLTNKIDLNRMSEVSPDQNEKFTPGQWLASILSRKVLTETKIILTSRPYSLTCLCGDLKPQKMFTLEGFTEAGLEEALKLYVDEDKRNLIQRTIKNNNLGVIAANPISLFLLTKVVTDDQIEYENLTPSKLHVAVFEKFFATKNASVNRQQQEKMLKIEETCYKLLTKSKLVFSQNDLVEGLTLEDFEKYVMVDASVITSSYQNSEGEKRLVFTHQTFQEYLAAKYVLYNSELEYFKVFVKTFILSQDVLMSIKWSTVRRFICTMISKSCSAEITLKRTWFIEEFSKKINSTLTRYINNINNKFYMQEWQARAILNQLLLFFEDLIELEKFHLKMKIINSLDLFEVSLFKPVLCFLEKYIKNIKTLSIFDDVYRLGGLNYNLRNTKIYKIRYHFIAKTGITQMLSLLEDLSKIVERYLEINFKVVIENEVTLKYIKSEVVKILDKSVGLEKVSIAFSNRYEVYFKSSYTSKRNKVVEAHVEDISDDSIYIIKHCNITGLEKTRKNINRMSLKKTIKLFILSANDMSKVIQMYEKGLNKVELILDTNFNEQDEVIKTLISTIKMEKRKVGAIYLNKFRPKHILEVLKELKGSKDNIVVEIRFLTGNFWELSMFNLFASMYSHIIEQLVKESVFTKVRFFLTRGRKAYNAQGVLEYKRDDSNFSYKALGQNYYMN